MPYLDEPSDHHVGRERDVLVGDVHHAHLRLRDTQARDYCRHPTVATTDPQLHFILLGRAVPYLYEDLFARLQADSVAGGDGNLLGEAVVLLVVDEAYPFFVREDHEVLTGTKPDSR